MLRFIQRTETDPYYNLAAEEYFLKAASDDTFMTWRNDPSVIIGKHQNALKEINSSFIEEHKLPVIRRITGGGAVYHDAGNLNFTFIFTNRKDNLIDFLEFTSPIILFLQTLGLNAAFEGKNNITVNGLKISGNSAHLFKNKVLYHGTILFNTNLGMLDQAINGNEDLFTDKAVRSIRAKVANISELLPGRISIDEFILRFQEFIFNYFGGKIKDKINEEANASILKMAEEKYRTYQWNYGYSPDYEFHNRWIYNHEEFTLNLEIKEGLIQRANIIGPDSYSSYIKQLNSLLPGINHDKKAIQERLLSPSISFNQDSEFLNQFLNKLF